VRHWHLDRSAASMNPRRPWTGRVLGHTRRSSWSRGAVSTNLEGGSATSAQVHRWAVEIWRHCAEHGIILVSGWLPDEEVVRLGADRLSREAALDVHGYTEGPLMQADVATLCQRHGCSLTLDLFATAANHQCPRAFGIPTDQSPHAGACTAGERGMQRMYHRAQTAFTALLEHIAAWACGGRG
jgi:hypothetical protein